MLSRISQFRQTLSDELEQAVSPQKQHDSIGMIERHAQLLRTETPAVEDIAIDLDSGEDSSSPEPQSAPSQADPSLSAETKAGKAGDEQVSEEVGTHDAATSNTDGHSAPAQSEPESTKAYKEDGGEADAQAASSGESTDAKDPTSQQDDRNGEAQRSNGNQVELAQHSRQQSPGKRTSRKTSGQTSRAASPAVDKTNVDTQHNPQASSQDALKEGNSEKTEVDPPQSGTSGLAGASANDASASDASGLATNDTADTPTAPPSELPSVVPSRLSSPSPQPLKNQSPAKQASSEKTSEISLQAKLAKFAKYEQKYPQLLQAYKVEKKKNALVKEYEKVLGEHTPCTSIAEPKELVRYLESLTSKNTMQQKELERLTKELSTQKRATEDAKRATESMRRAAEAAKKTADAEKEEHLQTRMLLEQAQAEAATIKRVQEGSSKEADAELRTRVSVLEDQLSAAENARDTSAKSLITLRSQLDEITLRANEKQADIDVLRDAVAEAERLSQERLEELSAAKQSLRLRDKGRRRSEDGITSQLSMLTDEKEQLEAEVEVLEKRLTRETEQLQVQIKTLRGQLRDSEAHGEELRHQLEQQQSLQVPRSLRSPVKHPVPEPVAPRAEAREESTALAEARAAAEGASKANALLKQVNADNVLRIEKLQKGQRSLLADLDQLRHQNAQLRRRRESVSSATGAPGALPASAEGEKQQAYLRNVLLGFIEHKDQRKMLMPVLATLLGLQENETKKFMDGFA